MSPAEILEHEFFNKYIKTGAFRKERPQSPVAVPFVSEAPRDARPRCNSVCWTVAHSFCRKYSHDIRGLFGVRQCVHPARWSVTLKKLVSGRLGVDHQAKFHANTGILTIELGKEIFERTGLTGQPIRSGGRKHGKERFCMQQRP